MKLYTGELIDLDHLVWQLDFASGREDLIAPRREVTPGWAGDYSWGRTGSIAGTVFLCASLFCAVMRRVPMEGELNGLMIAARKFDAEGFSIWDFEIREMAYGEHCQGK